MGKFIYLTTGSASEYSKYGANGYVGCEHNCHYCYLKKGVLSSVWDTKPHLKKCFTSEQHALEIFKRELQANIEEVRKHGIFFSFSTDPLLSDTRMLTIMSVEYAISNDVPVKVLSKSVTGLNRLIEGFKNHSNRHLIAVGTTLTGHDELESGISSKDRAIEIYSAKLNGFKTFVSFEPIIDFRSTLDMIDMTIYVCDLLKIGLMSGKKYDKEELRLFIGQCIAKTHWNPQAKIYFKDSLLAYAGMKREELPEMCVSRDYNLFTNG